MFDASWENKDVSVLIPLWGIHTLLSPLLGVKRHSRFQQVEHTAAKQCVHRLYEGLCGPHTFSLSSPLNNRCIHTFTQASPEDQQRMWSWGKNKTCLFCISKAQCKVWKRKFAVIRGVMCRIIFIQLQANQQQEVTVSGQQIVGHITLHKSTKCHFHTSVFVQITQRDIKC